MAKKKTLQEKANLVDNVITDKGMVTVSMKSVKWIIGTIAGLAFSILGFAYGFKSNLDNKIDDLSEQMKNDKIEILEKIETLKEEEITPTKIKNVVQDGDIKVLFDRTTRGDVSYNSSRPNYLQNMPPDLMDSIN